MRRGRRKVEGLTLLSQSLADYWAPTNYAKVFLAFRYLLVWVPHLLSPVAPKQLSAALLLRALANLCPLPWQPALPAPGDWVSSAKRPPINLKQSPFSSKIRGFTAPQLRPTHSSYGGMTRPVYTTRSGHRMVWGPLQGSPG